MVQFQWQSYRIGRRFYFEKPSFNCNGSHIIVFSDTLCLQVEADPACRKILELRQKEGYIASAPIFRDVTTVVEDAGSLLNHCEGIVGGFPCQDALQHLVLETVLLLTLINHDVHSPLHDERQSFLFRLS